VEVASDPLVRADRAVAQFVASVVVLVAGSVSRCGRPSAATSDLTNGELRLPYFAAWRTPKRAGRLALHNGVTDVGHVAGSLS
jgi:hypothetical protein